MPAQTEVTLGPGDAVIIPDYAATGEIRSVGDDPVVLVGLAIYGTDDSGSAAPQLPEGIRAEVLSLALPLDWEKLPTGPVRVSVRLLSLPAGANVGPYEPIGLEAVLVERGATYRNLYGRDATAPSGPPLYRGKGQVQPFVGVVSGIRKEIAIGDEPAELLVVLIEPAGITLQALAP